MSERETPSSLARRHFGSAMDEARGLGLDLDAVARATLALVVSSFLERRPAGDVRAELTAAAENVDPDTDYVFMRP